MATRPRTSDLETLSKALRLARMQLGFKQSEMAEVLAMSRKTYVLFETARWYPPYKERAFIIRRFYLIAPSLVPVFLHAAGETLAEHTVTVKTAPPQPVAPLSAAATRAAVDTAIAEVAVERDMTIGATRKIAVALVTRLAAANVGLAELAKAAAGVAG